MTCKNCGTKLGEQEKFGKVGKTAYYRCPNCNETQACAEKQIGVLGITVMFIFFTMMFQALTSGEGDEGIIEHYLGFLGMAATYLIYKIQKNDKPSIQGIIAVIVGYSLLIFGAVNNFPEFIRRIPGGDFVELWNKFICAVYGFALIIEIIICAGIITKNRKKLRTPNCSGQDWMLLKKSNRITRYNEKYVNLDKLAVFEIIGYYLLKAKLCGIINFRMLPDSEDTGSTLLVERNNRVTDQELEYVYNKEPYLKKIIEFLDIRGSGQCEYTTIYDIIKDIEPKKYDEYSISWEIESSGGRVAIELLNKLRKPKKVVFAVAAISVYYIGLTKLFMGVHNNKQMEDLLMVLMFFSPLGLLLFYLIYTIIYYAIIKKIVKKNRVDIPDYGNYVQKFLTGEAQASTQEQEKILQYYVTHTLRTNKYKRYSGTNIFYRILNAIYQAEAAEKAKRSSDSGCGGCSGCSGCSGCGGCGGCGD